MFLLDFTEVTVGEYEYLSEPTRNTDAIFPHDVITLQELRGM